MRGAGRLQTKNFLFKFIRRGDDEIETCFICMRGKRSVLFHLTLLEFLGLDIFSLKKKPAASVIKDGRLFRADVVEINTTTCN